jgi:hypothetical protein
VRIFLSLLSRLQAAWLSLRAEIIGFHSLLAWKTPPRLLHKTLIRLNMIAARLSDLSAIGMAATSSSPHRIRSSPRRASAASQEPRSLVLLMRRFAVLSACCAFSVTDRRDRPRRGGKLGSCGAHRCARGSRATRRRHPLRHHEPHRPVLPYTNNACERALRPSVIFRKVTTYFRAE